MVLPTLSMPHMIMICSIHLYFSLEINIFDNIGSKGNSAILLPNLVSSIWSFMAPRAYRDLKASYKTSWGGGLKSRILLGC